VRREEYDGYIRLFNEQDPAAFDDYFADDMHMQNGLLEFDGRQAMRDHYAKNLVPIYRAPHCGAVRH
jgi:hypothetical protein